MPARTPFRDLFQVDENGCWCWQLHTDSWGYGHVERNGYAGHAHRWMWMHLRGPIPDGLHVDHLCRNRVCVNPDHMELVSPRVNLLRSGNPPALNAVKTHCKRGHPFDVKNTYYGKPRSPGGARPRHCRRCKADWQYAKTYPAAAVLRAER